jgi:hypothetical protein
VTQRTARNLFLLALALVTLLALVMQGCATYPTEYPPQPRMTATAADMANVNLTVRWHDSQQETSEQCKGAEAHAGIAFYYGCAYSSAATCFVMPYGQGISTTR